MSKTEYNMIKLYVLNNVPEIKKFIEKLKSSPGILGEYDTKLMSVLVGILNKSQNGKNGN